MSFRDFRRKSVSRRHFLKTSALTGATFALPLTPVTSRAASLKPVSVTLDWVYQGPNAGFMVAREKGFYTEAGFDVSITAGKGSASTAQLVAAKACQVGFVDGFVVGNGNSKGMNIKSVGSIFRRNPCSIMVFEDSPIKTAKDLEGKTVAISAGSAVIQQLPAFCKGAGVDASKIQIVNMDPAGIGPALITGKVDAIGAYVSSYVPTLEIRGKKPVRILWFSDAGVIAVSNGITMHDDLDQERSRPRPRFCVCNPEGFPVRPPASGRGSRRREDVPANGRFRDYPSRAGSFMEAVADTQYDGQAAGLGFGSRLEIDHQRSSSIWRRNCSN